MCLDHGAFVLVTSEEEVPLGDIASVLPGANRLRLIDAFGKTREIAGTIVEIDLLNRRLVLA